MVESMDFPDASAQGTGRGNSREPRGSLISGWNLETIPWNPKARRTESGSFHRRARHRNRRLNGLREGQKPIAGKGVAGGSLVSQRHLRGRAAGKSASGRYWELQSENQALAPPPQVVFAAYLDGTPQAFDDGPDNDHSQSPPGRALLGGKKGFEHPAQIRGMASASVVFHANHQAAAENAKGSRHIERPGFDCIHVQVVEYMFQSGRITP